VKRSHRAFHPLSWILVALACAAAISVGLRVRPAEPPASLPEAASRTIEEAG